MASSEPDPFTTIQLRKATRDRLKSLGGKGDTYDAILNRLLDELAEKRKPALSAEGKALVDFERLGEEEHDEP